MELGCRSFVEMEWTYFLFIENFIIITHSMPGPSAYFFFVLGSVTLPQPGLGRIAEQVISSITKMPSFARGNCGLSGELMTAPSMHC
jgi:hypothetical protein